MKATSHHIFLHDAVLLLALRDREGTIEVGSPYQYALAGGIVGELLLAGRVVVDTEGKKDYLRAAAPRRLGDPLLDECLEAIAQAPRRKTVQAWVAKFAGIKRLKHRIAERLCTIGVLRAAEDRVLGIFNRRVYPEVDHGPEAKLVEAIARAVLSDDRIDDPRLVVLVTLARHAGLLPVALPKRDIKARKERLQQIENGEVVGKAVKGAVDAMNAAIMAAVIIPVVCAGSN